MTFVALWRLSHYDVCRIMTFVVYDVCRSMMFVALWCLSPIMTFVAYMVCRSIGQSIAAHLCWLLLNENMNISFYPQVRQQAGARTSLFNITLATARFIHIFVHRLWPDICSFCTQMSSICLCVQHVFVIVFLVALGLFPFSFFCVHRIYIVSVVSVTLATGIDCVVIACN